LGFVCACPKEITNQQPSTASEPTTAESIPRRDQCPQIPFHGSVKINCGNRFFCLADTYFKDFLKVKL
jgi:hypothetical protein